MEELRQKLAPLTSWLPDDIRDRLPVEAWCGIYLLAVLIFLWVLWAMLRSLFRGRRGRTRDTHWETSNTEELGRYPPLTRPPGANVATVYNVPTRLRLVIVAPVGKAMTVDPDAVAGMLDQVVPGLGQIVRDDKPAIRVWPAQMSHHGFGASFHRTTVKPEPDGSPSPWILAAGRAQAGKQPIAVGMAFHAGQANTVGRLNLEPHQWLDVVRLRPAK